MVVLGLLSDENPLVKKLSHLTNVFFVHTTRREGRCAYRRPGRNITTLYSKEENNGTLEVVNNGTLEVVNNGTLEVVNSHII